MFVQDADLVDAVHEAPQLCNRRPGKPAHFVKGFEPLLYFKRLDVLRDSLTESFDEVVADIVLNDGYDDVASEKRAMERESGARLARPSSACSNEARASLSRTSSSNYIEIR